MDNIIRFHRREARWRSKGREWQQEKFNACVSCVELFLYHSSRKSSKHSSFPTSLGYNENTVRWQIWTALLAYLPLRFVTWNNKWNHPFSRLFTLVRSILLNYFKVASVIEYCDFARKNRE